MVKISDHIDFKWLMFCLKKSLPLLSFGHQFELKFIRSTLSRFTNDANDHLEFKHWTLAKPVQSIPVNFVSQIFMKLFQLYRALSFTPL